ncbi:MAG: tetratricopeptide repeat protein [Geitlerinemataceae cyanobacterium]
MNVFILCTGRCGSTTFVEACSSIQNYTSAHESRTGLLGDARFQYPENHIEADNRLAWFLGRLENAYGDRAFYVHLTRDREETAQSYSKRVHKTGIMNAYARGIIQGASPDTDLFDISLDYWDTVNSNIELFLLNKTHKMKFSLETAKEDFEKFWHWIGAQGDSSAALSQWDRQYNASKALTVEDYIKAGNQFRKKGQFDRAIEKYQEGLQQNPHHTSALFQLAVTYERQKEFEQASTHYQRAVQLQPENAEIYARLARVMKKQGNIQEALITFQKAITLQSEQPAWVYSGLGDALYKQGDEDNALAAYQKAIEINPEISSETYHKLIENLKLKDNRSPVM